MLFDKFEFECRRSELGLRRLEAHYRKDTVPEPVYLCDCGCGTPTKISWRTDKAKGYLRGVPLRFVNGHNARIQEMSQATRQKISESKRADRNPMWKGKDAKHSAVHQFLNSTFPKAGICEECRTETRTDYAFLRHGEAYTRSRGDYRELCRSCHLRLDRQERP